MNGIHSLISNNKMAVEKRRIKAVFFDLDDTLVLTKEADIRAYQCVTAIAKKSHPSINEDQIVRDWRHLFAASPWDPEGQVPIEEWRARLWSKTLQNQGITDNENEGDQLTTISKAMQHCFTSTRLQHFQFAPTVVDLVSQLKSSGYKIAIITNGHAEVQRSKLVACAAHDLFNPDWIVVGGEEIINGGNEKPHPSIFTKACRLVDCQPAEAVIVGDSLKCDVQGGINAGLAATVWVNNNDGEKKVPVGGPVPTYIVKCIAELPAVLEELEK